MLIFHGHQAGAYTFILDSLRQVLAGRPVEKLAVWTWKNSDRGVARHEQQNHECGAQRRAPVDCAAVSDR
jgi:hypothetical protein